MIKTILASATILGATLLGATPAVAFDHTGPDKIGRPAGHAMYGHDAPLEDEPGWDCRYQGNQICGATQYANAVRHNRLALCDSYHARIGTQEQWISCVDRAYSRPIFGPFWRG